MMATFGKECQPTNAHGQSMAGMSSIKVKKGGKTTLFAKGAVIGIVARTEGRK